MSNDTETTIPPHLQPMEAVIFAALLDNRLIERLRELAEDRTVSDQHQVILDAMLELSRKGTDVDFRNLRQQLQDSGKLAVAGGIEYLSSIDLACVDFEHVVRNWAEYLQAAAKSSASVS